MLNKDALINAVSSLDEPIALDDVIDKLILLEKVGRALADSGNGNTISDEELTLRIAEWQ